MTNYDYFNYYNCFNHCLFYMFFVFQAGRRSAEAGIKTDFLSALRNSLRGIWSGLVLYIDSNSGGHFVF